MSPATRKRLYREGRRLLGPDRMSRLRDRGRAAAGRIETGGRRAASIRARLRGVPWIGVNRVERVDSTTLLVGGRLDAGEGRPDGGLADGARLTLAFEDGEELDVTPMAHPYVDRAAERAGGTGRAFALLCPVPEGGRPRRLTLRLAGARRHAARCPAPGVPDTDLERAIALLEPLAHCAAGARGLLDTVLGPAVERARASREAGVRADGGTRSGRVVEHNAHLAPNAPATTIIVPVYGRHDFIAHQLVHFARDADVRDSELIYVIDDPRLHAVVERDAASLARLHDIAFSVLYLPENLGYAGANNAAARLARGDSLLLLNSDVLPRHAGWLGQLRASAGGSLEAHVLGARLLYDDDSVQHDGMRFEPGDNFEGLWQNRHLGKGLPHDVFPSPAGVEPRDAVTGACLLVSRHRYEELGGLDEGYLLGDFEDSDFCMKARRAGLSIAIAPRVTLYHLERQSQSLVTGAAWKRHLTHYNCWRHDRRWHAAIVELRSGRAGD